MNKTFIYWRDEIVKLALSVDSDSPPSTKELEHYAEEILKHYTSDYEVQKSMKGLEKTFWNDRP